MDNTGKVGTLLPVAGLLVGVAGLIFGIIGTVQASKANKAINDAETGLAAAWAKIGDVDSRASEASASAQRAVNEGRSFAQQTNRAFESVGTELTNLRTAITKVQTDMAELAKRGAASPKGSKGASIPPGTLQEDGSYVIKSGDTFANLARRFSISINQLVNANPGVNPKALKVGQKIKIPGAKPAKAKAEAAPAP